MAKRKPLPQDEAKFLLHMQNMNSKAHLYKLPLELSDAEIDQLADDTAVFEATLAYADQLKNGSQAFFQWKKLIFDGDASDTPVNSPAIAANPLTTAKPGIIARAEKRRQKIYIAAGFTDPIGMDLDLLEDESTGDLPTDELTAAMKVTAKQEGEVAFQFSLQGQDSMRIEWRLKGETAWNFVDRFTGTKGSHMLAHADPQTREYRCILIKNNEKVGNYSPTYTVVTTP